MRVHPGVWPSNIHLVHSASCALTNKAIPFCPQLSPAVGLTHQVAADWIGLSFDETIRMFEQDDPWMPLYLASLAGASTCLGAAVVFFHPTDANNHRIVSPNTMSFSLALAGSVMVTVSVISIGPECLIADDGIFVPLEQFLQRLVAFCMGGTLYFALSWFAFPEPEELIEVELKNNPRVPSEEKLSMLLTVIDDDLDDAEKALQEQRVKSKTAAIRIRKKDDLNSKKAFVGGEAITTNVDATGNFIDPLQWDSIKSQAGADLTSNDEKRAWRVAMLLFVSLLLHNFPEGLAVAASALESRKLGITVTIGIMIHNIPEGIAIAIPCLAARPDSPWLGFALASLSGLAEPLGAFVALYFLRDVSKLKDESTFFNMENVLAFVAGIMIMVAMYELFPEAKRHTSLGHQHLVAGTICGIVIMTATEMTM
ncbi:ZIP Zinc transporter [Fragilaria crotonensis]|nr:ZIP Zinc transporter [Fragilaria crotonensis]